MLPVARARDRAGVQDPQADPAGARLRARHAAVDARGAHGRRRPGRGRAPAGGVGAHGRSRCRSRCSTRPTARSPGRSSTTSRSCAGASPRDVVTVFVPEYVVGHWWEHLLHNQSALRLQGPAAVHARRHGHERALAAEPPPRPPIEAAETRRASAPSAGPRPRRRRRPRLPAEPGGRRDRRPHPVPSALVGTRSSSRSVRSPTAATAWPGTRDASSSCATPCPASVVRARVTEGADDVRFLRADAVEVLDAVAGPGPGAVPVRRAGAVRRLRLAARRPRRAARAEGRGRRRAAAPAGRPRAGRRGRGSCPGATRDGLGWRTRARFAVDPRRAARACAGTARTTSSPLDDCPIAHPRVLGTGVLDRTWPGATDVQVAASVTTGEAVALVDGVPLGRTPLAEEADGRAVAGHRRRLLAGPPGCGATRSSAAVRAALAPRPGEHLLDLYAGVGLFAGTLAPALGPGGRVDAVEAEESAVRDARRNLHDLPHGQARARPRVADWLRRAELSRCDLVVLDPPRTGAGRQVVEALARLAPRARRLRRLRPGVAGPGRRDLRGARLRADRPARLRPVPDDAPRRVRRAPHEDLHLIPDTDQSLLTSRYL